MLRIQKILLTATAIMLLSSCHRVSMVEYASDIDLREKMISTREQGHAIFFLDFDQSPTGLYNKNQLDLEWNQPYWSQGIEDGRAAIIDAPESLYRKSLRIYYPKGKSGPRKSGAQWKLRLNAKYDEIYCAYSIKFQDAFDFARGGKLPGLAGGKANTGGNRPDGTDGWSARMMWRHSGSIEQYMYYPDQRRKWGEDFPWGVDTWDVLHFEPGVWYTVEHHIKMNTPSRADGLIECWLNGQPTLKVSNLRFRDTSALAINIFFFSTFFGGQGPRWAPSRDEYIFFDNFIISTKPITN